MAIGAAAIAAATAAAPNSGVMKVSLIRMAVLLDGWYASVPASESRSSEPVSSPLAPIISEGAVGINASAWAYGHGVVMVGGPHYAIHGWAPSLSTLRCVCRRVQDLLPTVDRRWLSTCADVRRARRRPATITRTVIASGSTGA